MYALRTILALLAFYTALLTGCTTSRTASASGDAERALDTTLVTLYTFPDDWVGKWGGPLQIFKGDSLQYQIPMELHLLPTDTLDRYTFIIIYDGNARDYAIEAVDKSRGLWVIDERNTIAIESYVLGNALVSQFGVQTTEILSSYQRVPGGIISEIFSTSTDTVSTTGGTSEQIPAVYTYPVTNRQRAMLRRVE